MFIIKPIQDLVLEYGDSQASFASSDDVYGSPGYKAAQKRFLLACKALQEYVRSNVPGQEYFTIHDEGSKKLLAQLEKEAV
jgi:hypothetical protein